MFVKFYHCHRCERFQQIFSRCRDCGRKCKRVEVERDRYEWTVIGLSITALVIGLVGLFARSLVSAFVSGNNTCCLALVIMYFVFVVIVLGMWVFDYLRCVQRADDMIYGKVDTFDPDEYFDDDHFD